MTEHIRNNEMFRMYQEELKKASNKTVKSTNYIPILRVNQIDSQELDDEILRGLFSRFVMIFSNTDDTHSSIADLSRKVMDYIPEIKCLMQLIIYKYTIWDHHMSIGSQFLNLKFAANPSKTKLFIHLTLTILIPYILRRINEYMTYHEWNTLGDDSTEYDTYEEDLELMDEERPTFSYNSILDKCLSHFSDRTKYNIWYWVNRCHSIYQVFEMVHFFIFLMQGRYPSIPSRLLNLPYTYIDPTQFRQVSFAYMNMEIFSDGLAEVLIYILPLIPISAIRRAFSKLFQKKATTTTSGATTDTTNIHRCVICERDPVETPADNTCGCAYCWYCFSKFLHDASSDVSSCPRCNQMTQFKS